jgi:hypothetical protein
MLGGASPAARDLVLAGGGAVPGGYRGRNLLRNGCRLGALAGIALYSVSARGAGRLDACRAAGRTAFQVLQSPRPADPASLLQGEAAKARGGKQVKQSRRKARR